MMSDTELATLYNTTVRRPPSYFQAYTRMPPCPIRSWNFSWNFKDFPRCVSLLDFQSWITSRGIQASHLAYTYESDPEIELLPHTAKTFLPYPPHDLHTIGAQFPETFDFFLFNQTLEHLQNPFAACKSIFDSLVPGGYVYTSVPTLNIPHCTPYHYGGYTPMGLAVMIKAAGFEILDMGQWGNSKYLARLFATHEWPDIGQVSEPNGTIPNEERNVCQCWVLAQKPLSSS